MVIEGCLCGIKYWKVVVHFATAPPDCVKGQSDRQLTAEMRQAQGRVTGLIAIEALRGGWNWLIVRDPMRCDPVILPTAFRISGPELLGFPTHCTGDPEAAADLMQDLFLKVVNVSTAFPDREQAPSVVADLRLARKLGKHVEAAFNMTDIFDKRYYATVALPSMGNYFGEPRAFMLTLKGTAAR